jgi:hypothetical protein
MHLGQSSAQQLEQGGSDVERGFVGLPRLVAGCGQRGAVIRQREGREHALDLAIALGDLRLVAIVSLQRLTEGE